MKKIAFVLAMSGLAACGQANDSSSVKEAPSGDNPRARLCFEAEQRGEELPPQCRSAQGSESILDGVASLRRIGNVSQIAQGTPGTLALSFTYRSCQELEFRGEAAEVGNVTFVKVIQTSQETCRGPERDFQGHASLQRTSGSIISILNPLLLPNQAVPSLPGNDQ